MLSPPSCAILCFHFILYIVLSLEICTLSGVIKAFFTQNYGYCCLFWQVMHTIIHYQGENLIYSQGCKVIQIHFWIQWNFPSHMVCHAFVKQIGILKCMSEASSLFCSIQTVEPDKFFRFLPFNLHNQPIFQMCHTVVDCSYCQLQDRVINLLASTLL